MRYQLIRGDCTERLADIASQSVNAVITDPPYPEIDRDYGRLTEAQWWDMMMIVCRETRRILKPTGSAVFILQPNSRKVGSMRGWLWEFMAWVCRDWNMVQDAWWWNITAMTLEKGGLMRSSLKAAVWCGSSDCYRDQNAVLWSESLETAKRRIADRINGNDKKFDRHPSGLTVARDAIYAKSEQRGGVTPYNVLPMRGSTEDQVGKADDHGASTPLPLAAWWTRYICPPGGVVCDPFTGSGTMGLAALAYGCQFIGIEKEDRPGYYPTAAARLAEAALQPGLPFTTTPSNNGFHLTGELAGLQTEFGFGETSPEPPAGEPNRYPGA